MRAQKGTTRALILSGAVLVLSGCSLLMSGLLDVPRPRYLARVEKNIMVEMRDGVRLATDVYRPAGLEGPLPVILTRLPYNKDFLSPVGELLAGQGYIYVVQDCRACFHSEGEVFVPMVYDHEDGMDTVAWIQSQPWFNGRLGTWGPSYLGITQWAVAADNPHLKCMYAQITTASLKSAIFSGGVFHYRLASGWSAGVGKQHGSALPIPMGKKVDWETEGFYNAPLAPALPLDFSELRGLSIAELQEKMARAMGLPPGEIPADFVERMIEMMNYPAFAEYADAFNFHDRYQQVSAPVLMVAGWYDIFIAGQLEDFVKMRSTAPGEAGRFTKIIIGPWGHVSGVHPEAGRDARLGVMIKDLFVLEWYDRWLRDVDNGIENEPAIKLYVMGANRWREEREWPLARTRYTKYYLHSAGHANSAAGDGKISTTPPGPEPADHFTYDPRDPVPTTGGNNLLEEVGAKDQAKVEARSDVLVYTSEVLEEDLEVTGPITAVLYAQSSAVDTDFMVKLCDVGPDGTSFNLTEGAVRARYRESLESPSLLEPGRVYEFQIQLWPTSNCFRKGHRIRVQVTSSNFPHFDRNTNAGGEGGPQNIVIAHQTILHDADHPSHLVLPVIP